MHVAPGDAVPACGHLFGHLGRAAGGRPRANGNAYPASLRFIEIRDAFVEIDIPFLDPAHRVLLAFDRVEAVDVRLTKVRPPLAVDATSTSVRIRRTRAEAAVPAHSSQTAYVALGSNLGDREEYLRLGVCGLGNVTAMSDVFETDPVGGPDDQGPFLNMVVEIETSLDPYALLRRCQRIEAEAMRQRIVHWGPRTLDVDIVLYDGVTMATDDLIIPHPRFAERAFVLAPLADIAPERCPAGWKHTLDVDGIRRIGQLSKG